MGVETKMIKRILFLVVLLGACIGIGMSAMAQSAKSGGSAQAAVTSKHANKGVACKQCHDTKKPEPVAMNKCVTCHSTKSVAQRTANVKPNPHDSRHFGTEADCNTCHHQHKPSVSLCADCHPRFNFKVP
jgi:Cytochrome c3